MCVLLLDSLLPAKPCHISKLKKGESGKTNSTTLVELFLLPLCYSFWGKERWLLILLLGLASIARHLNGIIV